MNRILTLSGLAATSSILMTTTALADISASEVWQAWQEDAARMGMTLSATANETGAGLDLTALEYTATIPQFGDMHAPVEIRLNIGEVSLNNDGAEVSVAWPDNQQGVISVVSGEDAGALSFESTASGRTYIISGSVDEMTYDLNFDGMTWKVSDWSVTSDEISTEDLAKVVFEISGMVDGASFKSVVNRVNGWQADMSGAMDKTSFEMMIDSGNGEVRQSQNQSQTGVSYQANLNLPENLDFTSVEGLVEAMKNGLSLVSTGSAQETQQRQTQTTPLGEVVMDMIAKNASGGLTANNGLVKLAGTYGETNINVTGGPIPPVSIAMAGLDFDMTAPLVADGTRARYMMALNDFTLNDEIWGMFDPSGVLPRDPAQLTLDLSADPAWQMDILDLAALETAGPGNLPLAPTDIRLDAFELSAAGASITGTGEMTVNYDALAEGGEPAPAGHIDLAASGLNGLMDNLTKMGFLPEEQAMGARMMMGLFAVPGDGEDTLQSRLEVTEEGHILANGQRLK